MDHVEAEGDTLDEAIAKALKILGVGRDQAAIEVLAQPRKGLLGLGTKKARVRAAPTEGKANAALVTLMAKSLGVPPRNVEIAGGAMSRIKRVHVVGNAAALAATLEKLATAR